MSRAEELKARKPVLSTRQFQKAVEDEAGQGTRGTSYASVYEYVEGKSKTEPPLSFLRPAAKVLGVRLAWLISKDGKRTEEEHLLEHAGPMLGEKIRGAGGKVSWDLFIGLVARLVRSCPDHGTIEMARALDPLGPLLEQRVLETYRALNPSGFEDQVRQNDHLEAMLHAMALAVPDRDQGVPVTELLKNLKRRQS